MGNPYTHWAFFEDELSAQQCAAELSDYRTRINPPNPDCDDYALAAEREVEMDNLPQRHREVEAIVIRHGGEYDGGSMAFGHEGTPIPDPAFDVAGSPLPGTEA